MYNSGVWAILCYTVQQRCAIVGHLRVYLVIDGIMYQKDSNASDLTGRSCNSSLFECEYYSSTAIAE